MSDYQRGRRDGYENVYNPPPLKETERRREYDNGYPHGRKQAERERKSK
jgi:hypothetical protein